MKTLYLLGLICFILSGCVSESWVRGYVQNEMAGVKGIVAEEVYPLEKALTDVRTQMATLIVRQKEVSDGLQALKGTISGSGEKWQEVEQEVAGLQEDSKRLEAELESLKADLRKLHQVLAQVQRLKETEEGQKSTTPEAQMEKVETPNEGRMR